MEIEERENGLFIVRQSNPNYKPVLNATNDNIEWAKWTWNPVTGCRHACPYCYAQKMAENPFYEKGFPTKFNPTFHPDRLPAVKAFRVPKKRAEEPGIKNVFVCSMADLFGEWVPAEWIQSVIDTITARPDMNFLFLTKNLARYAEFVFPGNAWLGATADNQRRFEKAREVFSRLQTDNIKFLSCEPLREFISCENLDFIHWLIVGGLKNSENTEKQPEWLWVEHLLSKARDAGCYVYFKPNLTVRPREFPI